MSITAASVARGALTITDIIGDIASFGVRANNVPAVRWAAQFAAKLIPGGGVILDAIEIAMPYIVKAAAVAPQIQTAINTGMPIIAAIDEHAPKVMKEFKAIFATAVNHDPERVETKMTAADVSDEQALAFIGSIFERSFFSPQDPRFSRVTNFG